MVKITYTGDKPTRRRLPTGLWVSWRPKQTIEIESKRLAKELEINREFVVDDKPSPKGGGGIKTHFKAPKRRGRPPKSKAEVKEEKVKPPKSVIDKVKKAKPKNLKKPKGLKRKKKGKAD
tara:strand:- start:334 stop:693 length:360 start_codon:yes stop_codon:yes gene_type:complete